MYLTQICLAAPTTDAPRPVLGQLSRSILSTNDKVAAVVVGYAGLGEHGESAAAQFSGARVLQVVRQQGWPHVAFLNHACASVLFAVEYAHALLSAGTFDHVVVLGATSASELDRAGMSALGTLGSQPPRPFADDRDGTALGAAQYALTVSSPEAVKQQALPALAQVSGLSCRVSAEPRAGLCPDQAAARMQAALRQSRIDRPDIVEAHATGTPAGDAAEAGAIARVFAGTSHPKVRASKAAHGHWLHGAACPSIADACRDTLAGRTVLVNAFGFSGNYASAVLTPPPQHLAADPRQALPADICPPWRQG